MGEGIGRPREDIYTVCMYIGQRVAGRSEVDIAVV